MGRTCSELPRSRALAVLLAASTLVLSCAARVGERVQAEAPAPVVTDGGVLAARSGPTRVSTFLATVDDEVIFADGLSGEEPTLTFTIEGEDLVVRDLPLLGLIPLRWGDQLVVVGDRCPFLDVANAEGRSSIDCTRDKNDPLAHSGVVGVLDVSTSSFELLAEGLPSDSVPLGIIRNRVQFHSGVTVDLADGTVGSSPDRDLPPLCAWDERLLGIRIDLGDADVPMNLSAWGSGDGTSPMPLEVVGTESLGDAATVLGCENEGVVIASVDLDRRTQLHRAVVVAGEAHVQAYGDPVDAGGSITGAVDASGSAVFLRPMSISGGDDHWLVYVDGTWMTSTLDELGSPSQRWILRDGTDVISVDQTTDSAWIIKYGRMT